MSIQLVTHSEAETAAVGRALGAALGPGMVIALSGDLGAGKTALARGIGAGLGVPGAMQSPTYLLVQWHEGGRLPLAHADWYRVGDEEELLDLALDELLAEGAALVVEWWTRFPDALPADRLEIELVEHPLGRELRLRATGPRHAALLEVLRA